MTARLPQPAQAATFADVCKPVHTEAEPWPEHTGADESAYLNEAVLNVSARLRERQVQALHAALSDGYARGMHKGYLEGWHWGLVCGVVIGALGMGLIALGVAWWNAWGLL